MTAETRLELGLLEAIEAPADDVAAAVRFYRDVLGAAVGSEDGPLARVRLGGVDVAIRPRSANAGGWLPVFRVPDIAAARAALDAAGTTILRAYEDAPGGVVLTFADPDGNAVQLLQHGPSAADLGSSAS